MMNSNVSRPRWRWAFLSTLLLSWSMSQLPAQSVVGSRLPPPEWRGLRQGDAIDVGVATAPLVTLFAIYTSPRHRDDCAGDGACFATMQQRFAARGLRVVAVVDEQAPTPDTWAGCGVVAQGAADPLWSTGEQDENCLLVDRAGTVVFVGLPGGGLVDAVENSLAGKHVLPDAAAAFARRRELRSSFDDMEAAPAIAWLEQLLVAAPRDGSAWGLLYLSQANKANDDVAAEKAMRHAIEQLSGEPRALATFADLALRGNTRRVALANQLDAPLRAAAKGQPQDVVVQLAWLRSLVQIGDGREVARAAIRLRKLVTPSASHCIEFVSILCQAADAPVHRDLATMVVDRAAELGAAPRLVAAARYGIAVRCAGDGARAETILDQYLGDAERVAINNDCWYLMTQLTTMGRFDAFAAGLADRMLLQRDAMDYFEFDTAALAMFGVGRWGDAVDLQETAIKKGGQGNRQYLERLDRYRAASRPAPR